MSWTRLFIRRHWLKSSLILAVGALALIGWRSDSAKREAEAHRRVAQRAALKRPMPPRDGASAARARDVSQTDPAGQARAAREAATVNVSGEAPADVKAFRDWARGFFAAADADRAALQERGQELAKAHTKVIAGLIKTDPQSAIANAVPMVVRQDLPANIVALLEERLNLQGAFQVIAAVPHPALPPDQQAPSVRRMVTAKDGRRWNAFTFGRRAQERTRENVSLNGVAVGKDFAVSASPVRQLETGERPQGDGREVVEQCPVSGIATPVERTGESQALPAVTTETPAFETAERIVYVCSGGHISAVEEQIVSQENVDHWASQGVKLSAGGGSGPVTSPLSVPSSWTTGQRKLLYIRATFPDHREDPQSDAECHTALRQMNDYMVQSSYGRCYFTYTVAPLVVLPYPESWYLQYDDDTLGGGDNLVQSHARAVAKAMGYDTAQYDFDVVRWDGAIGPYGGQAYVGSKGVWMKTNSVGTLCHELGHNLGVWHSNFWLTTPPSVIGPGENYEYGNIFDVMGSSGSMGHFTAFFKQVIGWLPQETYWEANSSGTYRIHQYDGGTANPDQRYALRVGRDAERKYWYEFRQKHTSNNALMNGLMVTWDAWGLSGIGGSGGNPTTGSNGGAHLLDVTPGSFGNGITDTRNDGALYVGRTYSDLGTGMHVTPIARNTGTTPPSMDVVVNLGSFPGNQRPTVTINPSSTTASVGGSVTLEATASDPDSDPLAYAWRFDDGTYSTNNSATQVKSWSSSGHYRVQCTVSDMKGGTFTTGVTITVGSPTTYVVSGTITGPGGLPLEGVYVGNYAVPTTPTPIHPNGSSFRGTWTESNGVYVLTRNTAGSRTITPILYPNVFTPSGFSNPLSINSNVSGINFTGGVLPTITITAFDPTATEGSSPTTGTIRIQRSGSLASSLAVQVFNTSTGTATRNVDYSLSPAPSAVSGGNNASRFIIPAGSDTLNITVTPTNDGTSEGEEYAVLDFANTTGGYVINGSTTGVVTISDDETALPVVTLTAVDSDASEAGPDAATLRLSRTGGTGTSLAVNLSYTGTALQGPDYAANTTVSIPSGSASTTFTIDPVNDSVQEGTETVIATIAANPGFYQRDALSITQTVVLVDDDIPVVTIVASDSSAAETGQDQGAFTISRTGGDTTQPLTVDYALSGSAIHGADYLRLDGRAVIPANATSVSIVILPVDDAFAEATHDVVCQLRSATGYTIGVPDNQATVSITDNDGSQVYVKLLNSGGTEPGSGTSTPVQFQVIRPAGGTAITVNYIVGGTASPGADYTALPGTISFGTAETVKTINVTALADTLLENAESVVLTLQPGIGYTFLPGLDASATGFIDDQDQPLIDVSVADTGSTLTNAGTESSSFLEFVISRRVATSNDLTVFYTMSGTATQGTDYFATSGSVVIPAFANSEYVSISPINDSIPEGVESIVMTITGTSGYGLGTGSATMLMADNDSYAGATIGFASSASTVNEAAGTISLPVNLTGTSGAASVRYRVNGGTATGGGKDYTLAEGTLSFTPGQTTRNISVAILQDAVPEPTETLIVQLFNAIGANAGIVSHTVTINNVSVPETWTDPATSVLLTSATLNGHVIPNGLATTVWFEYGGSIAYGSTTTPQPVGNGSTPVNVSASISGLTLSGYHFRLVSQNSAGTTYGADQAFGADATPAVTTLAASAITGTSATLNGTVNAQDSDTTVTFDYGTSTAFGSTVTATPSTVTGSTTTNVSADITGLTPGSVYYFRVRGQNVAGPRVGNTLTFAAANSVPVASFVSAPTPVLARRPITYSAKATDADGDPLTFTWDFGPSFPVQTGASIKQTFLMGGIVNLTLTVNDGHGGNAILTRTITVNDPAQSWTQMTTNTTDWLNDVSTNGSIIVAVGNFGSLHHSTDGALWTDNSEELSDFPYLDAITWDGTKFIAVGAEYNEDVGSNGEYTAVVYTSANGTGWSKRYHSPVSGSWFLSVSAGGSTIVAVGVNKCAARSTDGGLSWAPINITGVAADEYLNRVAYSKGNFVVTPWPGSDDTPRVLTSPNGVTWTDRTADSGAAGQNQDMRNVKALNGRLIASGWYSSIRTSLNGGQSFESNYTTPWLTPAMAYGDSVYLASGEQLGTGGDVNVFSVDGETWQAFPAHTTATRNAATFFKHRFYTVGGSGAIWRSGDLTIPVSIITQPESLVVLKGDSAQFSVFATGSAPLTYSWRKNGVATGVTTPTFTIPSTVEAHTGTYQVVVTNGSGSVASQPVTLTVNSPVEIITHPVASNIIVGNAKVFSIGVTGDAPITYQWRKDGVNIDEQWGPTLSLTDVVAADSGNYDCVVVNDFGTATSNQAYLNVQDKFLAFDAPTYLVHESAGKVSIPILRTGHPDGTITAKLTVTKGTAVPGSDYTQTSLDISVDAAQPGVTLDIDILNPNNTPEVNETFTISITDLSPGVAAIAPFTATVVIVDTTSVTEDGDKTPPLAPTISAPAANAFVGVDTGGPYTIKGNAVDAKGVAEVLISLNNGNWTNASLAIPGAPSTGYSLAVTPVTGLNTIRVKSKDFVPRESAVTTRSFTVTRPLMVEVDTALGSVTKDFATKSYREVGKSFTITATPKPPVVPSFAGAIFTGWTIGGLDVAKGNIAFEPKRLGMTTSALQKQAITFIFREGLELTANFSTNPYDATVAGTYNGLINHATPAPGNGTEGYFTAKVMNTGAFSGKVTIDGLVLNVAGSFDEQGRARFGTARSLSQAVARPNKPSLVVKFDIGGPAGSVAPTGTIRGDVTAMDYLKSAGPVSVSNVFADRAHFTGSTTALTVPDAYLAVTGTAPSPAGRTDGMFTVALPSVPLASQPARISSVFTAQDYPPGDGVGSIKVSKAGAVTLVGTLADGTAVTAATTLSQDLRAPLFASLYTQKGFLSAPVKFDSTQTDSDVKAEAGRKVLWSRPSLTTSHYYPYGWAETLELDLLGARYVAAAGQSVMRAPNGASLQTADADGNVALTLCAGRLAANLVKSANFSGFDVVAKLPANDPTFTMTVNRTSGAVTGTFSHTDDTVPAYNLIIIQKGPSAGARGYFLTKQPTPIDYTGQGGAASLIGQP